MIAVSWQTKWTAHLSQKT